jgi:hypothetical protein
LTLFDAIFAKHNQPSIKIESVEIKQQFHGLDILTILNNEVAILIEDKSYTSEHSNQLERYLNALKEREHKAMLSLPIYYKIGN